MNKRTERTTGGERTPPPQGNAVTTMRAPAAGLWARCMAQLKSELSAQEFATWILPLQARETAESLQLLAPNRFVRDWVRQHYEAQIVRICAQLSDGLLRDLVFDIGSRADDTGVSDPSATVDFAECGKNGYEERRARANLDRGFSFATFVEGKSNQIARAASVQIATNPGTAYNPLFIYGGVGLGKTHLMQAVGNGILDNNPRAQVIYVHSERFVSEMIKALQHGRIEEFKNRYRRVNALLIDDVQFFAGKDRSQEEFFHTFNALFESKQQIVLSSDRFPREVSGLEERLKSRFGWGLTVAIEPPDLETRVAILHSKAHLFEVELSDEVAFFVAKRLRSNVRELEGALRRLVANSRFTGVTINLDFARAALQDLVIAQDKLVTLDNIQKTVASYYKIRVSDLVSASRVRAVARPRQIAMTLAKELTKNSLPEIGRAFGGRDHTTVIHAMRKIETLRDECPDLEEDYKNLLNLLTS